MTSTPFELDLDDDTAAAAVPLKRRRTELYELTAQDAKSVIGQVQSSRISNAFAGLVDKKTATTGSLRIVPDGTGFVLTVSDLGAFDEHDLHTAIRNSAVWVSLLLVSLADGTVTVTFSKVPARAGASQVYRCRAPLGGKPRTTVVPQAGTEKLLTEALVPCPHDRAMLSSLVRYWMNYRGPRNTPEGLHWQLTCLDGTVIDSQTGASSKRVTAAAAAAAESKQYTLLVLGAHDVTLPEMMEPACMLPAHVVSTVVVPSVKGLSCTMRTYTSPLQHCYVHAPVEYSPD